MTRDEAVKKAEECFQYNNPGQEWFFTPSRLVAALENLGLLKLDESSIGYPPGMVGKTIRFMRGFHLGAYSPAQLQSALDAAGLKIVEK